MLELERGDVVDSRAKRATSSVELFRCTSYLHILLRALQLLTHSMGLPMDDIHTPTVPSGPTTGQRVANGVGMGKLSLMDLIAEKTRVEEELTALGSVLDSVCQDL